MKFEECFWASIRQKKNSNVQVWLAGERAKNYWELIDLITINNNKSVTLDTIYPVVKVKLFEGEWSHFVEDNHYSYYTAKGTDFTLFQYSKSLF